MKPTLRFAPSPTGRLHVGNLRLALVNYLFARNLGGMFLLRFDDTELDRADENMQAIRDDLSWMGLDWAHEETQSRRLSRYSDAADKLKALGRLYPCYETREELAVSKRARLARGQSPSYDRAGYRLTQSERAALEAIGRKPCWRFLLETGEIEWHDLVRGPSRAGAAVPDDPILVTADGSFPYMLPSVVDDIEFGVTHVIRGEEGIADTAPQIQLFKALGGDVPHFGHISMLAEATGLGLSKRQGRLSVVELREDRIEPMTLACLLARLGGRDPVVARADLAELAADFDITRYGGTGPLFERAGLDQLNQRVLREMPYTEAQRRLATMGLEVDEDFWLMVRPALDHLEDTSDWWRICRSQLRPQIGDAGFLRRAADLLPPEPWSGATAKDWTSSVQAATGRHGKMLIHPLRMALTGRADGPDLPALLQVIGRTRAEKRLHGQIA